MLTKIKNSTAANDDRLLQLKSNAISAVVLM